jgi:L-asparagine transporter-like permease
MMALGCVVGGSFFIGSSVAIRAAGPAILLSYIFGGVLVYIVLYALSEMTVANPTAGSFSTFAAQQLGEGTGFVVGWLYWTGTILALSSEAAAISLLIQEWYPNVSIGISGSIIIIAVTLLNLLGTEKVGNLASSLSGIKIIAILFFIATALALIFGLFPGTSAIGLGELANEPLIPGGLGGIAGSMLLVIFSYAGFEIIGLAASEAKNPRKTIPKAIRNTVFCLVGLYIVYAAVLLPLIPTDALNENISPMVLSLERWGIGWAGRALNIVLISALLSAMLASIFGLGRMIRSLTDEKHAPSWLKDRRDIPYRGILFSGAAMLLGLGFGLLFPRVYLVLISTGGFALIFTYAIIMASHIKFRKNHGCPPEGKCQMPGFPYTSWFALLSMVIILASMPFIEGQGVGLIAGIITVIFFSAVYFLAKIIAKYRDGAISRETHSSQVRAGHLLSEYSEELVKDLNIKQKNNKR